MMKQYDVLEVLREVRDPAKLALIVVQDEKGKFNATTLEWFMKTSFKPPMFAVSVAHTRYSHHCLNSFRYFNLCLPDTQQVEAVKLCGSLSGKDTDKFELAKLEYFPGKLSKLPIIKDALANFECKIISQVNSGDHTIFTGEIVYAWLDKNRSVMTYSELLS
ncbi:MAG: flavin reductase family protein [Candidatus Cloacimonadia bacterium]|jgi:flavin reductase (DIM6/NTAB) family NADH-FMN oxidoreductase RutF